MSTLSPSPEAFDVVELVQICASETPQPKGALREMPFRHDAWTPDEIENLKRLFSEDVHVDDIPDRVGHTIHAVRSKISDLGLRRNSVRAWTGFDDAELSRRYGTDATSDIARDLGRSCSAVYARAQFIGLSEPNPPEWTSWEDAQLCKGYAEALPIARIAAIIGRPVSGTVSRASKIGLRHPAKPLDWSDAELARALELAEDGQPYNAIIETLVAEGHPRRTKAGFGPKIRAAGYGRGWGKAWLPEEDDLLRKAYREGSSLTPLTGRLGRSKHSIRWRSGYLGLTGTHKNENGFRGGPDWSAEDLATLRAKYGTMSNAKLAKLLGRSKLAVSTRANVIGLVHGYIRPWSDDELRALQIAWRGDIAIADLAEALGRKAVSVSKFATKRNMHFGRRARHAAALTLEDILAREKEEGEGLRDPSETEEASHEIRTDPRKRKPGNDHESDAAVQRKSAGHRERAAPKRTASRSYKRTRRCGSLGNRASGQRVRRWIRNR